MVDRDQIKFQHFERSVVLPSARILPIVFSVIAVLMLLAAAVGLVYSVIPTQKPQPMAEPQPVSISPNEVKDFARRPLGTNGADHTSAEGQIAPSASSVALASELQKLRTQSSSLMLTWADQQETRCRERVYGVCIGEHKVLVARGVEGYVDEAFKPYDDDSQQPEIVRAGDDLFVVNSLNEPQKIAIVKELEAILAASTPTDAAQMMQAWAALRQEREQKRADAVRVSTEGDAANQRAYQDAITNRQVARTWSLWSAVSALGLLVLFGLTLAVLAIERHTRIIEEMAHSRAAGA
jgi:hypothetical protein